MNNKQKTAGKTAAISVTSHNVINSLAQEDAKLFVQKNNGGFCALEKWELSESKKNELAGIASDFNLSENDVIALYLECYNSNPNVDDDYMYL